MSHGLQTGAERARRRVRYNQEEFGYLVGFPDGDIVLAAPSAKDVLSESVTRAAVQPHLLHTLDVYDGWHLSTPPLAWIELTRRCNLSCPHCYIDAGPARARELAPGRWHGILDEMADMGVWAVAFTGGEPTLHRDFSELVCHARERDLLVGIATHGMFLTQELLDRMPRDGVIISVSIDDLHQDRGGKPVSLDESKNAILRAQRSGFLTNVMTNTHRRNVGDLGALMDWAEQNSVSIRSVPFSPIGERGKKHWDLENTVDDVRSAAKFWLRECEWEHKYHREAGLCVGSIFNYGLSLAYMTRRCSSGRFLCYVASDGTVFPCTMCAGERIFASGSVRERGFADVWRDEWEIRRYSWKNFESTCSGCVINSERYYCAARCPAMSHARHGTLFDCGASEFEVQSALYRTELLEHTEVGQGSNLPLVGESPASAPGGA